MDCGDKIEHKGKSKGSGSDRKDDTAWDMAKTSVRHWALINAEEWAEKQDLKCTEDCKIRRLELVIEAISDPVCKRKRYDDGTHFWECTSTGTWKAVLYCSKKMYPTPTADNGKKIDGGITERKRLKCGEEAWDEGTGKGKASHAKEKTAGEDAQRKALHDAYAKASEEAKLLRCSAGCPYQRIAVSTNPPSNPSCTLNKETNKWDCQATCDYKIIVDCMEKMPE